MSLFSLCICFPPSAKVMTIRGQIMIADLQASDKLVTIVRLNDGRIIRKETLFLCYIHFDPNLVGTFLYLTCEDGSELVISEDHLLFTVFDSDEWKAVRAREIEVEDRLIHYDDQGLTSCPRVVGIEKKVIKGLYAPVSMNGTLVVDNILTSCYANINSHTIAHAVLAPLRLWHRACRFSETGKAKKKEIRHPSQGIHKYARAWMTFRDALPKQINPK